MNEIIGTERITHTMTAHLHQHKGKKARFQVKRRDNTSWLSIQSDDFASELILFFDLKDIAHIMGQMEKALGEMETIAAHLDRDSDAELAPAGVSEQDGVAV